MPGIERQATPASSHSATIFRITLPGAVGMARFDFAHCKDDDFLNAVLSDQFLDLRHLPPPADWCLITAH